MDEVTLLPDHPDAAFALQLLQQLREAGQVAYLAGGCVRDALLGDPPKDFDIATDAPPNRVRDLFGRRRTLPIGVSFGVVNVLPPEGSTAQPIEVATFRRDGEYHDGRRPERVHFSSAAEDAQRRDFTINGLFYDPIDHQLIDYVGGKEDLQAGRIRAIGNPDDRIAEDKLRMLRAVRFAALLGFELDAITADAIRRHAGDLPQVSGERIGAELTRMLASPRAAEAIDLLAATRLVDPLFPQAMRAGVVSPRTRRWLVSRRAFSFEGGLGLLVASANPELVLAKPSGDPTVDAAPQLDRSLRNVAGDLFSLWKLARHQIDAATAALAGASRLLFADSLPWSQVQPALIHRYAPTTLEVAEAFVHAEGFAKAGIELSRHRLAGPPEQLDPPPLIDGAALKALGFKPGPVFRDLLAVARAAQLDGRIDSTEQAIALIKQRQSEVAE